MGIGNLFSVRPRHETIESCSLHPRSLSIRSIDQNRNPLASFISAILRNQAEACPNHARLAFAGHECYPWDSEDASRDSRLGEDLETVLTQGQQQVDPEEHASSGYLPRRFSLEMSLSGCDKHVPSTLIEVRRLGCVFEEASVAPMTKQC